MATQVSVPVPYALSDEHRRKRTMGKVTVKIPGPRKRWQTPSLEQPASTTILLPILNNQPKFATSKRLRREHRLHVRKMTVAQPDSWKKHKAPSAQERRSWVSKPSRQHPPQVPQRQKAARPKSPPAPRTTLWQTMIGPGTRLGGSKYAPITIEDDEEERVVDREEEFQSSSVFSRNSFVPSTPASRPTTIYASSPGSSPSDGSSPVRRSMSSRIRGAWASASSATSEDGRYRDSSICDSSRRGATMGARAALRSPMFKSQHPTHRSCPPRPRKSPAIARPTPTSASAKDSRRDLTLDNISDADTRRKVADLMVVAPAVPVKDLLDLVETKADAANARTQAVGATFGPSARTVIKSERGETVGPNTRLAGYDYDGDEVMIKIDPSESFLEYDTDSPPPEDMPSTAKGYTSRNSGKNKPSVDFSKHTSKSPTGVSVKKIKSRRKVGRKSRGNSITREFIVPDNVVHFASDSSSSDTDSSTRRDSSDVDMEDVEDTVEDLTIDMRSRFAYNSRILQKAKKHR